MAENKLADLSTEFAIQILKLTENIKGHYSLSNQLERSGTSIGANIREAKYAHSRPDFIAKLQIALKECYETEYWIEIAQKQIFAKNAHILHQHCKGEYEMNLADLYNELHSISITLTTNLRALKYLRIRRN